MGKDGRKRVEKDFSWENRANELAEQLTKEALKV